MNVLIAYAGKTGTTEKCSKILKALVDNSTLCDLTKESPDLSDYGCIVLGSSVRIGGIHKSAKAFLEKNKEALQKKKVAFFICNCFVKECDQIIKKNIPEDLLHKALAASSFGGEMNLDAQKGVDKLISKMVVKKNMNPDEIRMSISTEAINKFAEKIK
jgi:menaquinone-dependent protoporphyrinogen oxidase